MDLIGTEVTVYDRYLFAVPVKGRITDISEKDGAYAVTFYDNNPGGQNVIKHNGKFFHYQQCRTTTKPTLEVFGPIPCAKYKFTDKCGCIHNDRIPVELSPSDIERFHQTYKAKAESCRDYNKQKSYHEITDFLRHHFDGYKTAREKFDSEKL